VEPLVSERRPLGTGYIQTFSGKPFWPLAPDPDDVRIEDIAHALSLLCRFTGHVRELYTVGDHSLRVAECVEQGATTIGYTRLAVLTMTHQALLHDASEAYLHDIARPVKHTPAMTEYRVVEARVQVAVFDRFELPPAEHALVKSYDRVLLRTEQRDLMPPPIEGEDRSDAVPLTTKIVPRPPKEVEALFLARHRELLRARGLA
jgi:hypothetical protein